MLKFSSARDADAAAVAPVAAVGPAVRLALLAAERDAAVAAVAGRDLYRRFVEKHSNVRAGGSAKGALRAPRRDQLAAAASEPGWAHGFTLT